VTTGQTDELTEMAKHYGAKGLAFQSRKRRMEIADREKFFTEAGEGGIALQSC